MSIMLGHRFGVFLLRLFLPSLFSFIRLYILAEISFLHFHTLFYREHHQTCNNSGFLSQLQSLGIFTVK